MEDFEKYLIFIIFISFWICLLTFEVSNLNKRVEELEKQSEEVHEYILNKIGG